MQPNAKPIGFFWIDNPTLIEMPPNPHDPQPLLYESFIPWNPSCYETIMVSNPHENQTLMIHNPHGTQPSWSSTLMFSTLMAWTLIAWILSVFNPNDFQPSWFQPAWHEPSWLEPSWSSTRMILSPPAAPQSFSFGFAVSHPTTGKLLPHHCHLTSR